MAQERPGGRLAPFLSLWYIIGNHNLIYGKGELHGICNADLALAGMCTRRLEMADREFIDRDGG